MNRIDVKDRVAEANPCALFADGLDDAIIGYVERCGQQPLALYDRDRCIRVFMDRDKMSMEDAEEFFDFNVAGAWAGDGTPMFATIFREK